MEPLSITLPDAVVDLIVERVVQEVARMDVVEPWVGVEDVAEHLCCRRQRIYDLVHRRRSTGIPHRKEGNRLLFKLSAIDRWVESGGAA